jgi:hypothetical protein
MMSSTEVSFDPEWLEKAASELGQLRMLLENSLALKRLQESSTISGDLGGGIATNDAGGWTYLEQHISDICSYISKVTGDIKTDGSSLEQRMRSALEALKGADHDNKSNLNSTGA